MTSLSIDHRWKSASPPHSGPAYWRRYWPIALIVAATFLIRAGTFGNPVLEFDEQLYLLVGDRMLHGQLPYVDLWDRKPPGLFLFFAGVRLLGGAGIVQYQVAATTCVAITALLIRWMARRGVGEGGALVAAIAYVLFLVPLHGEGGQSPVIYNVAMVGAAALAFRANDVRDRRHILMLGIAALALVGIAIQFKYTPFVEGIFLGCYFLVRLRACAATLPRLAASALPMIAAALAPTLAAIGWYAAIGHLDAFVQANFQSVFHRVPFPASTRLKQRLMVGVIGLPLIALGVLAAERGLRNGRAETRWDAGLMIGWTVAALLGFGMLGDFYDFYFITVLPPLLVMVATMLPLEGTRLFRFGVLLLAWPMLFAPSLIGNAAMMRARTDRLVGLIDRHMAPGHCLYVYDGPAILYLLTGRCAPTRFIYPDHLTNPTEAPALGVDPVQEERRLVATKPSVIVTADRPVIPNVAPGTQAVLRDVLQSDYRLVDRVTVDRTYNVFARSAGGSSTRVTLADVQ